VAIVYALDKMRGLTVAIWDGPISRDEELAYVDQLACDPEWPGPVHLSDLTTADDDALPDPELLNQLATSDGTHARVAILGPLGARRTQEFARMTQVIGMTAVVREDLAGACAFLGIDVAPTRATLEAMRAELERLDAPARH
jgi:hypothetical protein